LHGDARWSVLGHKLIEPDEELEEAMREQMTGDPVYLTPEQRLIVERTIVRHCHTRGWHLHAVNARTNHVHVVLTASADPKVVRAQLKAWCSRMLSENEGLLGGGKNGQKRWWTEKGNIRCIDNDEGLAGAVQYVKECQD
jgi:REP element-mobilizing transposase RayT